MSISAIVSNIKSKEKKKKSVHPLPPKKNPAHNI